MVLVVLGILASYVLVLCVLFLGNQSEFFILLWFLICGVGPIFIFESCS